MVGPFSSTGPKEKPSARETYLMKLPMNPRQFPSQATEAGTEAVVFWNEFGNLLSPLKLQPLTLKAANET